MSGFVVQGPKSDYCDSSGLKNGIYLFFESEEIGLRLAVTPNASAMSNSAGPTTPGARAPPAQRRRALEVGALKLHCTGLEPLRPERVGVASPASWPEERVPADFLMVCASLDSEPRSQIPFDSGQSFSSVLQSSIDL